MIDPAQSEINSLLKGKKAFFLFRAANNAFSLFFPDEFGEIVVASKKGPIVRFSESGSRDVTATESELSGETTFEEYANSFEAYQAAFASGEVRKAILSAIIRVRLPDGFDPFEYVHLLAKNHPQAFVYLLNHPSLGLWCGASPEILLKGRGEQFQTVALAGTMSKNSSGEYNWGLKEKEEQAFVSEHIRSVLNGIGVKNLSESATYTVEAGNVAHLKTDFDFEYDGTPDSIVGPLHPTPAVEGVPLQKASELIERSEKHDRRLYTGYLGRMGPGETEVYVNLRCMQIGKKEAAVYVGGGLTDKSEVKSEWEETRLKAKTLLNLFKLPI